jgi:hypothetical protein
MTLHLVVTKAFLNYSRGDVIADIHNIQSIMAAEYRHFVTRVARPTASKG